MVLICTAAAPARTPRCQAATLSRTRREIQHDQGPCLDSYRAGDLVIVSDIAGSAPEGLS
jgi:hypothetical protein